MIQMLNDIWTSLVSEVEATKNCYEELEAAMTTTNDRLNDGISVSRTCSRGVQTCLKVQGLKGRVRQVAINYLSVACVPECENEVTRKVYRVS